MFPIYWLLDQNADPDRTICAMALSSELANVICISRYAENFNIENIVAHAATYGRDSDFCDALKSDLNRARELIGDLSEQRNVLAEALATRRPLSPVYVYVIQETLSCSLFSRIYIILEQTIAEKTYYFLINRGLLNDFDYHVALQPCFRGSLVETLQKRIQQLKETGEYEDLQGFLCINAGFVKHFPFVIEGNISEMAIASKAFENENPYKLLSRNCADIWTLDKRSQQRTNCTI